MGQRAALVLGAAAVLNQFHMVRGLILGTQLFLGA